MYFFGTFALAIAQMKSLMKKTFLLLAIISLGFATNAQTFKNTGSGLNQVIIEKDDTVDEEDEIDEEPSVSDTSAFDNISMEQEDKTLTFSSLPDVKTLKVFVTDAKGNEVIIRNIDKKKNILNIQRLKKGIFFATVIEEIHDKRKSFVVTIE